jgi:DNA invertase Pin-like site-specific DNA recombinase
MRDITLAPSNPRITVAYLRSASGNQFRGGLSLVAQRKICEDYARHLGVRISLVYSDVGVSGLSDDRVGLKQLLRDIVCLRIGRVIVAEPTRLSRSLRLQQQLQARIRGNGAGLTCPCPEQSAREKEDECHRLS